MKSARAVKASEYMNWAKMNSRARFNLATSGIANLRFKDLQVSLDDLEITGYGGGLWQCAKVGKGTPAGEPGATEL